MKRRILECVLRLFVAGLFAAVSTAHSSTIYVSPTGDDSDGSSWSNAFDLVGDALSVSSSGDHIWVASGTYSETITMGTEITLLGGFIGDETNETQRDPRDNVTLLRPSSADSVIICPVECAIDGFTIAHGGGSRGGSVHIESGTVEISNCLIKDNRSVGVYLSRGSLHMQGCVITENNGGGVSSSLSTMDIEDTTFTFNVAERGAAIRCTNSDVMLRTIIGRHNRAHAVIPPPKGIAVGDGAFWDSTDTALEIMDSVITDNVADRKNAFGLTSLSRGSFKMKNCTVANSGRVGFGGDSQPNEIVSSVLRGESEMINDLNGTAPTITYSNVEGGATGTGNIDSDPLFVDPDNGDYRLQTGSPCIDSASTSGPSVDIDGNSRPTDVPNQGRNGTGDEYDMGAYEFQLSRSDLNRDGFVNAIDLFIFQRDWQQVSGV